MLTSCLIGTFFSFHISSLSACLSSAFFGKDFETHPELIPTGLFEPKIEESIHRILVWKRLQTVAKLLPKTRVNGQNAPAKKF